MVTVNVDAAEFKAENKWGESKVARDHSGKLIEMHVFLISDCGSPEIAEAIQRSSQLGKI